MACIFDEVLDDEFVAVVEHKDEMGEFVDRIGNRGTPVSIELGGFMTTERTKYRPSHAIKRPCLLVRTARAFRSATIRETPYTKRL